MKIKTVRATYDQVASMPREKRKKPKRPNFFFRTLIRILSFFGMLGIDFKKTRGDLCGTENEPSLILMNHSSFLDMQIASCLLYPRAYGIVTTTDGFIGKRWLMRQIGCIPTQKFVSDLGLIRDMNYMLHEKKTSVLMFPEAGYSFDGRATVLPRKFGKLLKMLKVPVWFIFAEGAFLRTPLYNELKNRRVPIRAELKCLLTREQIAEKSVEELDAIIEQVFTFDHFAAQREQGVSVTEADRACGLERVLYKCPHCKSEGQMRGEGTELVCRACGKVWYMSELGQMVAKDGDTEYSHVPDWFDWQRACVREELESGTYRLDTPVDIAMIVNSRALYTVGEGCLVHDTDGFHLTGADGKLNYEQKPRFSYTLNADYYWYEIGDMISIGTNDCLYYCFPKTGVPVAKARLATEELFKISFEQKE